jgi:chromosome segregation ATPase
MRAVVCSLLMFSVINLTACVATQDTFATRIKAQSEQHIDLSQQWEQGQKDVNNARAQLNDGQKLIIKGKAEILEGEKRLAQARIEAQRQRQVLINKASGLSHAQSGIQATKLIEQLEDIADLWQDADDKFLDAKELIEDGNSKVAEGESLIQQGQTLLGNGRARMQQAEANYKQRTGSINHGPEQGQEQTQVEQMYIQEQPRNF